MRDSAGIFLEKAISTCPDPKCQRLPIHSTHITLSIAPFCATFETAMATQSTAPWRCSNCKQLRKHIAMHCATCQLPWHMVSDRTCVHGMKSPRRKANDQTAYASSWRHQPWHWDQAGQQRAKSAGHKPPLQRQREEGCWQRTTAADAIDARTANEWSGNGTLGSNDELGDAGPNALSAHALSADHPPRSAVIQHNWPLSLAPACYAENASSSYSHCPSRGLRSHGHVEAGCSRATLAHSEGCQRISTQIRSQPRSSCDKGFAKRRQEDYSTQFATQEKKLQDQVASAKEAFLQAKQVSAKAHDAAGEVQEITSDEELGEVPAAPSSPTQKITETCGGICRRSWAQGASGWTQN